MPYVQDAALDAALDYICGDVENLYICSAEPATFTAASSTYKLGTKATPTIGVAEAGAVDGRRRIVAAITDGVINTTGTAAFWALTDDSETELKATQALSATQAVTAGNSFTLDAISITFRDPT